MVLAVLHLQGSHLPSAPPNHLGPGPQVPQPRDSRTFAPRGEEGHSQVSAQGQRGGRVATQEPRLTPNSLPPSTLPQALWRSWLQSEQLPANAS